MRTLSRLLCLVVLVPVLAAGCDDDETPTPADMRRDMPVSDAGPDMVDTRPPGDTPAPVDAADAPRDMTVDTTPTPDATDTPADMTQTPDAPVEPTPEVGPEATPETGSPDAGPETGTPDAPDAAVGTPDVAPVDSLPVPDAMTGEQVFVAALSGGEEVPANSSTATGSATFVLNPAKTELAYTLRHNLVGATAAHLHNGLPNQNGGIAVTITNFAPESSGTLALTTTQAADLEAGRLYINIHTGAFSGGEIRGQVIRPGESVYVANLAGANENPAISTTATGAAGFILNAAKTEIRYRLAHNVVDATSAHLHTGWATDNGDVAVGFPSAGADITGTLALDATQAADFQAGKIYVNVHSAVNTGGEIRGQVVRPGETVFVARLSGAEEVPPVATVATGNGSFLLNATKTALRYNLRHNVTAATSAHLHTGAVTESGPIAVGIVPLTTDSNGTLSLTPTQAADLESGRLYANVHSVLNMGGEIRGQVLKPGEVLYLATLNGAQETPPVTTTATGFGGLILNAAKTEVRFRVATAGGLNPTAAHIHKAMAGVAGPVVHGIPSFAVSEGVQVVTPENVADLDAGLWYFNFHTAANPGGEIRGQLLLPRAKLFVAKLTGAQEVPAVTTTGTGNAAVILSPEGNKIRYHVTTDLTPTNAHFHKAPGGVSGPVELGITPLGMSMSGNPSVTPAQVADLERGLLYVNIHTTLHSGGEIRGQLLGVGEKLYTAVMSGLNEVPPVVTTATGGVGFILNAAGTLLRYDGTLTGLTPTMAHIHVGAAGANGDVVYPLNLTGTTLAGTQAVTAADVTALNAGGYYSNVHTAANTGGEIRGQITAK